MRESAASEINTFKRSSLAVRGGGGKSPRKKKEEGGEEVREESRFVLGTDKVAIVQLDGNRRQSCGDLTINRTERQGKRRKEGEEK